MMDIPGSADDLTFAQPGSFFFRPLDSPGPCCVPNLKKIAPMITQANIGPNTPLGANLIAGGATFRVWGPGAHAVYLNGTVGGTGYWQKDADPGFRLAKDANDYWGGFW